MLNYVCSTCWSLEVETFKKYTRREIRSGVRCCNCGREVSNKVNSEPKIKHIKPNPF